MADACGNETKNPLSPCGESDGQLKKVYFIQSGTTYADQATAITSAAHITNIQAGLEIPFPAQLTLEDASSGVSNEQTPLGIANANQGTVEHKLGIPANIDLYKRIESFTGSNEQYDVFYQTATGKLIMRKNTDGTIGGFEMDFNNVENPTLNDGSVVSKSILHISIDPVQWRQQAVSLNPDFSVIKLKALADVIVEVLTSSATTITFKVKKFSDVDAIEDNNPQYGLSANPTDFQLLTTAGVAQVISGVTGGTKALEGVYTASGTGLVSGTLDLIDSSEMTFKGINSVLAGTVTIP